MHGRRHQDQKIKVNRAAIESSNITEPVCDFSRGGADTVATGGFVIGWCSCD
jgi:hypothetical protein